MPMPPRTARRSLGRADQQYLARDHRQCPQLPAQDRARIQRPADATRPALHQPERHDHHRASGCLVRSRQEAAAGAERGVARSHPSLPAAVAQALRLAHVGGRPRHPAGRHRRRHAERGVPHPAVRLQPPEGAARQQGVGRAALRPVRQADDREPFREAECAARRRALCELVLQQEADQAARSCVRRRGGRRSGSDGREDFRAPAGRARRARHSRGRSRRAHGADPRVERWALHHRRPDAREPLVPVAPRLARPPAQAQGRRVEGAAQAVRSGPAAVCRCASRPHLHREGRARCARAA